MNRLHQINSGIIPDATDAKILDERQAQWDARPGPRVGDFVQIGQRFGRFSHDWGDGIQWSEGGSFYLYGPSVEFSGGLNRAIPMDRLEATNDSRPGTFWFFHHGFSGASRGVGATIPCRVFKARTQTYTVKTEGHTWTIEALDWSDACSEGRRLLREARKAAGQTYYEYWPKDMETTPGPDKD